VRERTVSASEHHESAELLGPTSTRSLHNTPSRDCFAIPDRLRRGPCKSPKRQHLTRFGVTPWLKCSVYVVFSGLPNSFSQLDFSHLGTARVSMPVAYPLKGRRMAGTYTLSIPIVASKFAVLRNRPLCGDCSPTLWGALSPGCPLRLLVRRGGGCGL
jgi:hypothetical protein